MRAARLVLGIIGTSLLAITGIWHVRSYFYLEFFSASRARDQYIDIMSFNGEAVATIGWHHLRTPGCHAETLPFEVFRYDAESFADAGSRPPIRSVLDRPFHVSIINSNVNPFQPGGVCYTLRFDMIVPEVCGTLLTFPLFVGSLRRRKIASYLGRCRSCGYDLRATPTRCPECGTAARHRQPAVIAQ